MLILSSKDHNEEAENINKVVESIFFPRSNAITHVFYKIKKYVFISQVYTSGTP
jgi:hypothetical protein